MPAQHDPLALLQTPVAQTLLQSTIPARLAYTGRDGTPRVLPIWFHWTGRSSCWARGWIPAKSKRYRPP